MKKKILVLSFALMMAASISACNAKGTASNDAASTQSQQAESKQDDTKQAESKEADSKQASSEQEDIKFPEFNAKTVAGEEISSDIFKDSKLTVVNIWGSWCGPCVHEIPELQKLYENMKEKNVNVVGIAQDSGSDFDAVKEVLDKNNVTYHNIIPEGDVEGFVMSLQAFPTTVFIDSNGNIVGGIQGARDLEGFTKIVDEILAKQG